MNTKKIKKLCFLSSLVTFIVVIVLYTVGIIIYNAVNKETVSNKLVELHELKDYKIPSYNFIISGLYTGGINNEFLDEKIQVYSMNITTTDSIDKYHDTYQGWVLKDMIELFDIDYYHSITISSLDGNDYTFEKEKLSDNMFIVFKKNDKFYQDEPLTFIYTTEENSIIINGFEMIKFN